MPAKAGGIAIRPATQDDLPGIVEIWKPFMDHHAAIDAHYSRTADAHEKFGAYLAPLIGQDAHVIFVAVDGDAIVGFAKASLAEYPPIVANRQYGAVTDMAVAQSHRRRGVGLLLLQACEGWLRGKGIHRIEVRILKGNPEGEGFWSSQGYGDFILVKCKRI